MQTRWEQVRVFWHEQELQGRARLVDLYLWQAGTPASGIRVLDSHGAVLAAPSQVDWTAFPAGAAMAAATLSKTLTSPREQPARARRDKSEE